MSRLIRSIGCVLLLCAAWCSSGPVAAQAIVVLPYVQPGDVRSASADSKVIHWFTEQKPGDFVVEFQLPGGGWIAVKPTQIALDFAAAKVEKKAKTEKPQEKKDADKTDKTEKDTEPRAPTPVEREQHYFKYTAQLTELPLSSEIRYRVRTGERTIREASFRTRARQDQSVRGVFVGDMAQGRQSQRGIAYLISQRQPEFLVALGDIVYPTGRVNQYMAYFFNTYNDVAKADPKLGAPLMASVPFYAVLGNHDIGAKLSKTPDALGAYYFFSATKNGPGEGPWVTPLDGDDAANAKFRAANKDSYSFIDAYSFDNGPAHFVVLNVNPKMDLSAPAFRNWLTDDLHAAKDRWKIVCFHMPGFHSSKQHYAEQQARPLSPIFEEAGVSLTFAGHVHNYQRTVPLKFQPNGKTTKKAIDGQFTLDKEFDGVKNTKPSGVIHIVSGGGGASLYKPGLDKTKDMLTKQYGENYADYTAKMVVEQNSFSVLDCAPDRLVLTAIGANGDEIDRVVITKK